MRGGVGLYDTVDRRRLEEGGDDDDDSSSMSEDEGDMDPPPKVRSPVATSPVQRENVYRSALSQQRNRVQMIREKIRAAITIQTAWRAFLQRRRR